MRSRPKLCTPEQKARVADKPCLVCGQQPCDPAHLIDKSLAPYAGEDRRAVVPLCRTHHRAYDDHQLDLSAYLEPAYREEVAWAVESIGLFRALRRITGQEWIAV